MIDTLIFFQVCPSYHWETTPNQISILHGGLHMHTTCLCWVRWHPNPNLMQSHKMQVIAMKLVNSSLPSAHSLFFRDFCSSQALEQTIKAAVQSKTYHQIPDILISSKESCQNANPFAFLSSSPHCSRPQIVYHCLLSYTLQNPDPFPVSLAIIQRTLRSGCLPKPQMHLLLTSAWFDHRQRQSQSVANILLGMKSIGHQPDCGTCNYVISSLCADDQLVEALKVLNGMTGAGCVPDLETYATVINAMCAARKNADAIDIMKEMVVKVGLIPRQGTVKKMVSALRANREIRKAVELIEFLEKEGYSVGFEGYELAAEGCLECKDYVLAAKVVTWMTEKGFIPYIRVRQEVVQGLASAGEWKLACAVRQKISDLSS